MSSKKYRNMDIEMWRYTFYYHGHARDDTQHVDVPPSLAYHTHSK